jgi:hypothetical protein
MSFSGAHLAPIGAGVGTNESLDKQSVPKHAAKSKMFCTRLYLPVIISHLSEREGFCYDFQAGTLRTSLFGRERSPEHSASYLDFSYRYDSGTVEFRHDLKVLVVYALGRCAGTLEGSVKPTHPGFLNSIGRT